METQFLQVACKVHINWSGLRAPSYRLYVNNELFTERTWKWRNVALDELIQLEVPAGKYKIIYELLDKKDAVMTVENMRVIQGPGRIKNENILKVL